ncbi:MAG: HD domain-containing phosphohydrolase [Planctomycetota bacterium]|nr:HD domain-containing phosphohydrolase [Planctomycetota bacterium]
MNPIARTENRSGHCCKSSRKWDGSRYPKGLSGNAIPVEGRIVAVANVFDALSSTRPSK